MAFKRQSLTLDKNCKYECNLKLSFAKSRYTLQIYCTNKKKKIISGVIKNFMELSGETPTYGYLTSFVHKYQEVPSLEASPHYTKILLRFKESIKVDILTTIDDRLAKIKVVPHTTSTNFKSKLVFLYCSDFSVY